MIKFNHAAQIGLGWTPSPDWQLSLSLGASYGKRNYLGLVPAQTFTTMMPTPTPGAGQPPPPPPTQGPAVNYVPLSGGGNVIPQLDDYTYDALNRIASMTEAQQNSSGTWTYNVTSQTFTYDRWGNRAMTVGSASSNLNQGRNALGSSDFSSSKLINKGREHTGMLPITTCACDLINLLDPPKRK